MKGNGRLVKEEMMNSGEAREWKSKERKKMENEPTIGAMRKVSGGFGIGG